MARGCFLSLGGGCGLHGARVHRLTVTHRLKVENGLGGGGSTATTPCWDLFWVLSPNPSIPLPQSHYVRRQWTGNRVRDVHASPLDTHPLGSCSRVLVTAIRLPSSALAPGEVRDWGRRAQPWPRLCSPPPTRAFLALPREETWVLAATPVAETHLEAFFFGNEVQFEGLPTLEGRAKAELL